MMSKPVSESLKEGKVLLYQHEEPHPPEILTQAIKIFDEALKLEPTNIHLLYHKAFALYKSGKNSDSYDLSRSLTIVDDLIEKNMNFTSSFYLKAIILYRKKSDKSYYDSIKNMDVNDEEGYYIKTSAKMKITPKEYEAESSENEELLLKVNVNENFDAFELLAKLMQKSDPAKALIKIDDFIKTHPDVILGYKMKTQLCMATQDLPSVISALETWSNLLPKNVKKFAYDNNPYSERVKVHLKQKKADLALKVAEEWLKYTPLDKQALEAKFDSLKEIITPQERYEKILELAKDQLITIDMEKFYEANGTRRYYGSDPFLESLDKMISYPLLEIQKNFICNEDSKIFCDGLSQLKNHEWFITTLDYLYKKSMENKDLSYFYLRFLNMQACFLIYNKKYKEAKECLEAKFSDAEEYNKINEEKVNPAFIFQNYCLCNICLNLNQRKEAFLYSEAMAYLSHHNNEHSYPTLKFLWINFPLLRKEIMDDNMMKEIRNTKRKELKKEAKELLDKAFALTFNGQDEDVKKAIEFIDEGLKIEPDSSALKVYKYMTHSLIEKEKKEEISLITLTQMIRNDIGFLPTYYLKNYTCYHYKEYKNLNKPLKPLEKEDFFIKAFLPLENRPTTSKHSFENLEKCSDDKRFERKVLDLKRLYCEMKGRTSEALAFSKAYFEKYPNFNKEILPKIFINLINEKKFDESIDLLEKMGNSPLPEDYELKEAMKSLTEHIENESFSEEGFKLKCEVTKIMSILNIMQNYPTNYAVTNSICLNLKGTIVWTVNNNLTEALELFEKAVALNNGYQYDQRNRIYHTHVCKLANLLENKGLAMQSCQKAIGFLRSCFPDDEKSLRKKKKKYYKKILLEEIPKLYNEEFVKKVKERNPEQINEKAKANYEKALEALHWKGKYSNPRENEGRQLMKKEIENDKTSFMMKFQNTKFSAECTEIDELIEMDPYYLASYYLKLKKISYSWGQQAKPHFFFKLIEKCEPNPNDLECFYQIGSYYATHYRYADSFKYYEKLPLYYVDAHINIVEHYCNEKQKEKMMELLDLLIKTYPTLEWAYRFKSKELQGKEMIEMIHIWAKLFPNSEELKEFLECHYEVKKENGCLERLQLCYKYFPKSNDGKANFMKAVELFAIGEKGLDLAKLTILTTDELIKFCENDTRTYRHSSTDNFQGNLLMILGKYEESAKCYEKLTDSNCAFYQCNRGLTYLKLNKIKSAFPAFEKAYSALLNKNLSLEVDNSNPNPEMEKYIRETIIKERKNILASLIEDINKHAIVLDDVKILGEKVQKLERQLTSKNIDSGNEVLKDLQLVTEKIKENDKSVEKLNKEKDNLLKIVQETENKQSGFIELTAQVEIWKTKADKAKEDKDKLENQYKSLEDKVNLLFKNMESVNTKVDKIDSNVTQTNKKVDIIEQVQKEEEKVLEKHENALKEGGVYAKLEVKRGFSELESQDVELYAYCKTFYWTMLNYFGGYRNVSTGLMNKNVDLDEAASNKLLIEGVKKVAEVGKEIAKGVPFVGSVIGGVDKVVDIIYGTYKEKKFDYKVKIVNLFIQKKFLMEEDISLEIGKLAIDMAKLRKEEIYKPVDESKLNKVWNWLNNQMTNLSKMVFPYLEINTEKGSKLALKDTVSFFAYLFKNHKEVIENQENLSKQFELIIKYGSLENLIREAQLENQDKVLDDGKNEDQASVKTSPEKNVEIKTKKTCNCNIF